MYFARRGGLNCTYDANSKITAEGPNTYTLVLRSEAPLRRVAYDPNGNTQTRYVAGEGTYSYSYDYKSWLVGMTYPNQTRAGFVYNGDGLRIKAREPDSAEEDYFLYDGVRPYMRMESAQGLPRAVYVSEGGTYYSPIVTLRTANANWTYLRDGMESVRKILNESQTTTDAYTFEAFGNPMGQAGTTVNPFRYVGALGYYWFDFAHHGRDRTTSLRLLGARYYGPSPRRFWTQDPVGLAGVNVYPYVANNPVNRADPSGLHGFWDCLADAVPIGCEVLAPCAVACIGCRMWWPACIPCAICVGLAVAVVWVCATHEHPHRGASPPGRARQAVRDAARSGGGVSAHPPVAPWLARLTVLR